MTNRKFDLVVFGATSFAGKIVCEYLIGEHLEPNFSWAMAARSESKLQACRLALGEKASDIPLIIADSFDEPSLTELCRQTHVVISTVGPFALYGDMLVKTCAENGTDYCDLTGEAQWVRRMFLAYGDTAKASGARLVNCCGFDSIPSDLGVKFLQQHAQLNFDNYCDKVRMRVKAVKGGASGGTIASAINVFKEAAANSDLRAELRDFYSLCPESHSNKAAQRNVHLEYDVDFKSWVGSFIMAGVNTRVVLRSNALNDTDYAEQFYYDEGTLTGDGAAGEKKAKRIARFSRMGPMFLAIPPIRAIITRFFLPKPGEGPSAEEREAGFWDLRFMGTSIEGDKIWVKVTGDRDPGYGSSAKMLAQAGISLRRDVDKGDYGGGFWTPAAIFGDRFIERLQAYAGFTFELESIEPASVTLQESPMEQD